MLLLTIALALQPAPPADPLVGRPIGAALNSLGQPARAFDLEGQLRAFQWPTAKTPAAKLDPVDVYSTPGILSPPPGAVDPRDPEQVTGQGCYETLYAQWALDDWIVIERTAPPADCR
jgi:hypothetical protein